MKKQAKIIKPLLISTYFFFKLHMKILHCSCTLLFLWLDEGSFFWFIFVTLICKGLTSHAYQMTHILTQTLTSNPYNSTRVYRKATCRTLTPFEANLLHIFYKYKGEMNYIQKLQSSKLWMFKSCIVHFSQPSMDQFVFLHKSSL